MVHNPSDRSMLVLSISDNGIIWHDVAILENTPNMEYSYPFIQYHDGLIDILYTYNRKKIKHVRFNQAWLNLQHIKDKR
jgi:predicted neuraminidase